MECKACGHEHQGAGLAYICIGCPCPEKRLAAYDAREPLVKTLLTISRAAPIIMRLADYHESAAEFQKRIDELSSFDLAERQAAPANLESVAQPDTPDAHVGERSAYVNDLEFQRADAVREVVRLRKLIAEGDFRELYAEGLTVGASLGRAESNTELARLQEIALRVKLGQLEVWPDASKTHVGRALCDANAKLARVEALVPRWRHGTDSNGKTHAAELEAALSASVAAVESGESGA
jgi:hypothetical protein